MRKPFALTALCIVAIAAWAGPAWAEVSGRYRLMLNNNRPPIEGEISEEGDFYIVKQGIATLRIPKTQVAKLIPLDEPRGETPPSAAGDAAAAALGADVVEAILGSENVELDALEEEDTINLETELPLDRDSLDDMMRIAGRKARYFETPHFVFVYTSEPEPARKLAARLESTYRWCVTYINQLNIHKRLPRAKLEIFYFGTFDEYAAYQTLNGFRTAGALGFYMRTNNRSAFFEMTTWPVLAELLKRASDPAVPADERNKLRARSEHYANWWNLKVVQHEAGHHMHFNMGIYPRFGDLPRWMTEGLATMFEVPPTEIGAGLGATNHDRLIEFRRFYGTDPDRVPWEFVREVIVGDYDPDGYQAYVMGWALNHYLWHEHREKYAEWLRLLGERENDFSIRLNRTEKQEQFEDIFGKVDEAWVREFVRFILSIEPRPSLIAENPLGRGP